MRKNEYLFLKTGKGHTCEFSAHDAYHLSIYNKKKDMDTLARAIENLQEDPLNCQVCLDNFVEYHARQILEEEIPGAKELEDLVYRRVAELREEADAK